MSLAAPAPQLARLTAALRALAFSRQGWRFLFCRFPLAVVTPSAALRSVPYYTKGEVVPLLVMGVLRRGAFPVPRRQFFLCLGVFLVLFFRFSRSFFRCWRLLLAVWVFLGVLAVVFAVAGFPFVLAVWALSPLPFAVWFGAWLLLRRLLFVRLPAPSAPVSARGSRWVPLPPSSPFRPLCRFASPRWVCVPASAVPGWLALVGGASVRPAVVRRRSGVLLFAWVLVPCVRRSGRWVPLFAPPSGGVAAAPAAA